MVRSNPTTVAFNGGEGDDETMARVDLDIYRRMAKTMENVFPYTQGKMSKAPGSEFLDDVTALAVVNEESGEAEIDEDGALAVSEGDSLAILRPFVRKGDTAYVLELAANQCRFIDNATGEYLRTAGTEQTLGGWTDVSAPPPTGGDPPIIPGFGGVGDPFYPDIDYGWITLTEGGGYITVAP